MHASKPSLTNNVLLNNAGGGIRLEGASPSLIHTTMALNGVGLSVDDRLEDAHETLPVPGSIPSFVPRRLRGLEVRTLAWGCGGDKIRSVDSDAERVEDHLRRPTNHEPVQSTLGERDMDLGIEGRPALVTGASAGLGLAAATSLAREGFGLAVRT